MCYGLQYLLWKLTSRIAAQDAPAKGTTTNASCDGIAATCERSASLTAVHRQPCATASHSKPAPYVDTAQAQPFGRWAAQEMAAAAAVGAAAAKRIPSCTSRQSRAALVTSAQPGAPCGISHSATPAEPKSSWPRQLQLGQHQAELRRLLEEACRQALCQTRAVLLCLLHCTSLPVSLLLRQYVLSVIRQPSGWMRRVLLALALQSESSEAAPGCMPPACMEGEIGHSRRQIQRVLQRLKSPACMQESED